MPSFIAYNYSFEPLPKDKDKDLKIDFPEFSVELNKKKLNAKSLNESFLNGFLEVSKTSEKRLNLYSVKTNKDSTEEPELYENNIEVIHDGVVLMMVRSHKTQKYTPKNETKKKDIDDYPWCYVIIDTRPESRHILIEKKTEVFSSTDMVCEIIRDYCSNSMQLANLGWEFQFSKRYIIGEVWKVVDSRVKQKKDSVKYIGLHFYKKEPAENDAVEVALQLLLSSFATAEGDITVYNKLASGKSFDYQNENMRRVVDLMIRKNYTLKIKFDKTGSLVYNQKKQIYPEYYMEDNILFNYKGQPNLGLNGDHVYELIEYIDNILTESEHFEYEIIKKKDARRKKKNKATRSA